MALINTTNPEQAAVALATAIEKHLDGASDAKVSGVELSKTSGLSNETVLFDAEWSEGGARRSERLVARVQPTGPAVFPRYDFALEFMVMSALDASTDVPVPGMLFHEDDASVLGAPFIAMKRVDGRVPADDPPFTVAGWVPELSAGEQATLSENAVRVLAQIHAVDIDAAGLGAMRQHAEAGLDGQIAFWQKTFEWAAEGDSNPTVETAFRWVRENRPADEGPTVLCWGDARIGNMMFGAGMSVTAVLDWEMTSVAPAGIDVGWWLFMSRYYTEGIGAPQPAGFPGRAEFLTRYSELTGAPFEDPDYYEVLAALRLSILMHRAGNLMIAGGLLPPDAPMKLSNPASQLLAKLLGLPAPEGATQSFVGNRA